MRDGIVPESGEQHLLLALRRQGDLTGTPECIEGRQLDTLAYEPATKRVVEVP